MPGLKLANCSKILRCFVATYSDNESARYVLVLSVVERFENVPRPAVIQCFGKKRSQGIA